LRKLKLKLCLLLLATLVLFAACGGDEETVNDVPNWSESFFNGGTYDAATSPLTQAWRAQVLRSPVIAEVENNRVMYEVLIYDGMKYAHDTTTGEIIALATTGDSEAVVLRDWVVAWGNARPDPDEALFDGAWANTGTRARELIGYLNGVDYSLVTRARTADFLEYIYRDADEEYWRVVVTDDFVLFGKLVFRYVFDLDGY
jgi:hypothetical protein